MGYDLGLIPYRTPDGTLRFTHRDPEVLERRRREREEEYEEREFFEHMRDDLRDAMDCDRNFFEDPF